MLAAGSPRTGPRPMSPTAPTVQPSRGSTALQLIGERSGKLAKLQDDASSSYSLASLFLVLTAGLVHLYVLGQSVSCALHAPGFGTAMPCALLGAYEIFFVSFVLYIAFCNITHHVPAAAYADMLLLGLGLLAPLSNMMWALILPNFDTTRRDWFGFHILIMITGVYIMRWPSFAYSIALWSLSMPILMFLDFHKELALMAQTCIQAQPPGMELLGLGSCDCQPVVAGATLSFMQRYMITKGINFMACGLPVAAVTYAVFTTRIPCSRNQPGTQQQPEAQAPCWPFEALGLRLLRGKGPGWYCLLVSVLDATSNYVQSILGENRSWLIALPVCFFYFGHTLLARADSERFPIGRITPEEWILVIVMCFLLGRESMSIDMTKLLDSMQEQLVQRMLPVPAPKLSISDLIDSVRKMVKGQAEGAESIFLTGQSSGRLTAASHRGKSQPLLKLQELIGEGAYGKVFKGLWHGSIVAVKVMAVPTMTGLEKQERMAIMEAAISSSLSHPNIVQTFDYIFSPLYDSQRLHGDSAGLGFGAGSSASEAPGLGGRMLDLDLASMSPQTGSRLTFSTGSEIDSCTIGFQVQLVLEYCDYGSLRDALDADAFQSNSDTCDINYRAVLDTAADIARGMTHLHMLNVVHSDLKARNILLMRSSREARGVVAKVSDFGLSFKMDQEQTHASSLFQGTHTHMAPEVLERGCLGKAADVYSFGITLWELYTSEVPFCAVNRAYLSYQIVKTGLRPEWPMETPPAFMELAKRCWDADVEKRPTFEEVLPLLVEMRDAEGATTTKLEMEVFEASATTSGVTLPG